MTGMLRVVGAVTSVVVLGFAAPASRHSRGDFRLKAEATGQAEATSEPAGWDERGEGYRAALGRAGIVGSSLMIVRDGRIVARANEGLQDREAGGPATHRTHSHRAAITTKV